MKTNRFYTRSAALAVGPALTVAAAEFYRVRELLAALAIFTLLFGALGMVLLVGFLAEEAVVKGAEHFEASLAYVRARPHAAMVKVSAQVRTVHLTARGDQGHRRWRAKELERKCRQGD